jgi:hypothetical protein
LNNDVMPTFSQLLLDDIVIDSPVRQACRGKFAANSLKIDLGKATEVIVKGTGEGGQVSKGHGLVSVRLDG